MRYLRYIWAMIVGIYWIVTMKAEKKNDSEVL